MTRLNEQLAVCDRLAEVLAAKQAELASTETRIGNGEAALAARRANLQSVPPAWVTALAKLRVERAALQSDVADLLAQADAAVGTFCNDLGRYERQYDRTTLEPA